MAPEALEDRVKVSSDLVCPAVSEGPPAASAAPVPVDPELSEGRHTSQEVHIRNNNNNNRHRRHRLAFRTWT